MVWGEDRRGWVVVAGRWPANHSVCLDLFFNQVEKFIQMPLQVQGVLFGAETGWLWLRRGETSARPLRNPPCRAARGGMRFLAGFWTRACCLPCSELLAFSPIIAACLEMLLLKDQNDWLQKLERIKISKTMQREENRWASEGMGLSLLEQTNKWKLIFWASKWMINEPIQD